MPVARRRPGVFRLVLGLCLSLMVAFPLQARLDLDAIRAQPPGERYTQLSLLLLIAGGTRPDLVNSLAALDPAAGTGDAPELLDFEDYQTPLSRIVDQESMLAGAAAMIRFAQTNNAEIKAELESITENNPILVSMIDVNQITADAIIIRSAIADSIEYSSLGGDPETAPQLEYFRQQTVYLRNMMEYNIFQEELAVITDDAIVDLGGRLDAYQRMFDESSDSDMVRQRIESADIMNRQAGGRFDERARLRTAELLMMLILMESSVSY